MDNICGLLWFLFMIAFVVVMIMSMWKVFEKAGQPGWAALVPIYNMYILTCEVAKLEIMWFILSLIPLVNIVAAFVIYIEVAKKFGQGAGFGIGLIFLGFIFMPMLAFGDYRYQGRRRLKSSYDDDFDDNYERPRDDDDEDDDRRPRRRSRDDDEDDDFNDRPRRRRRD